MEPPLAKFIYLIIAVVLLWPLISRFVLRGRHPLAEAAAGAGVPLEAEPPPADDDRVPEERP